MKINWYNLIHIILFCWSSSAIAASLPDTIIVKENLHDRIDLFHTGFMVSSETDIEPTHIWQQLSQQSRQALSSSIGFSKNIFWIGFSVKNSTKNDLDEIIEIDNPQLDYVTIYRVLPDSIQSVLISGDKLPFHNRVVLHRNYLLPFHLIPGETATFILKLDKRNSTVFLPTYLWSAQKYDEMDYQRNLGYGLYFGFSGLCLIYALMAFIFIRKEIYIWYFLLVLASATYLFTALGFTFQYIYPFSADFNSVFRVYLEVVSSIILLKFAEHFLNIKIHTPRIKKALHYLLLTFITLIALSVVAYDFLNTNSVWILPVLNSLMLLGGVLIILSAILSYPQQNQIVAFFFTAFGVLMLGYGLVTLGEFGWVRLEKFPVNPVLIGSGVESFIFSIALSYQIKKLYDERNDLSLKLAEQQKIMLKSYIEGVERERVRIGRELHDDIGSRLSSIKRFMAKNNEEDFAQLQLDKLCEDVRTMSHQLAPPALHIAGFKKMIYELGYQTEQSGSLKVDIQFYDFPDRLPDEISAQLYRIVQEAINNVQKHADAQNIDMQFFGYTEELIVTIDDDGKGFSSNSKDGIGIQNMKARTEGLNGSLEISSKANKGTSLLFQIPLHSL